MRTWIITTRSGSEYILNRSETGQWGFGARKADGKGARLLHTMHRINEPIFPEVGQRLSVSGKDASFPASEGWLHTSRVLSVEEET